MHFVASFILTQVDFRIIIFKLSKTRSKKGLECVDSSEYSTEQRQKGRAHSRKSAKH